MEINQAGRGQKDSSPGPSEAAESAFQKSRERIDDIYRQRKASVKIIGYVFEPYTNRPKKVGYGKLKIEREITGGSIYQGMVFRDVHRDEAAKLTGLSGEAAAKEHEKRSKQPRYGFKMMPRSERERIKKQQLITA